MTREQEDRIKRLARTADYAIDRGDIAITDPSWWVGEFSYKLGIVDSKGMIDIDGEIARAFKKEFQRRRSSGIRLGDTR